MALIAPLYLAHAPAYDLLIIGGGSAGLTAAKFATTFGKSVAIVEKARMGGDCTWTGCVPSKTLLAIAKQVHGVRTACECEYLTMPNPSEVKVDMKAVKAKVSATIHKIYEEDDSPAALKKQGIDTIVGAASFVDKSTLSITQPDGAITVSARKGIIIATGASAARPPIAGLADVPFITYEEIFELDALPRRMTVVGGGPIGCELAQAFSRLGAEVTLVAPRLLPNEEAEAGEVMARVFEKEGIRVVRGRAASVAAAAGGHALAVTTEGGEVRVEGDTLLVATGRKPVVSGMNLEAIGVKLAPKGGIQVDPKLHTSCSGVYAAGDCTGDQQFTHYAGFQGAIAARNILLPLSDPGVKTGEVPACTFTSPEVAHIGMSEAAAVASFGAASVSTAVRQLRDMDRAICEGYADGFVKIVYKPADGSILGATIVAPVAGEMISEIAVAMAGNQKFTALASVMHPYPSYSMSIQTLAAGVYYDQLKGKAKVYSLLKRLGL
ncbi:hypothetical protein AB1Y20_007102 [Prymnesium parvum]|uniref:Mercuric reductase n=1 Tax=Prymnesium parvum TaxID=97485 RepID=A0AB34J2A8_PRYPA